MESNVAAYLSEITSLRLSFLQEAIESAKAIQGTPEQKRQQVIFYLKCTERSWRMSCNFERAYHCKELRQLVERSSTVHNARLVLLGQVSEGPVSNTGPPADVVQEAIFDYLGGSNGRNT